MNRHLRKRLIRLALAILAFVVIVGGYVVWDWYATRAAGERRLTKVLAELDAVEPGWRNQFAERNARLAPKERNAAYRIRDLWNQSPKELRDAVGKLPPNLRKQIEKAEPNQLLPGPVAEALRKAISPHDAILAEIRSRLSDTAGSGFPIDRAIGLAPTRDEWDVMMYLNLGHWLQSHARLCLDDGRVEEAFADVRAMLGLCKVVGDQPTIIAQLQRIAMATMAIHALEAVLGLSEPPGLEALQRELAAESQTDYAAMMFRGERLGTDEMLAELDLGITPEFQMMSNGPTPNRVLPHTRTVLSWQLARKVIPGQRADHLEQSTSLLRASRLAYREYVIQFKEMESRAKKEQSWLLSLETVVLGRYVTNHFEAVARLRTAVVAAACERYRQQFGHWPQNLSEIPKSILPTVPVDPFDDKPIRLAKSDTGLVTYSVGQDLNDDGGSVKKNATGGVDIGFRLYDLNRRRQPSP